jgi:hypothetical protein
MGLDPAFRNERKHWFPISVVRFLRAVLGDLGIVGYDIRQVRRV